MRGRPSIFTDAIEEELVERLSKGEPLEVICRDPRLPSARTVREWREKDERFSAAIAGAREVGFDAIAAQTLEIVDNVDEDPSSRKVRAETRLKLLSKWDPKRYGERLDVTSGGEKLKAPTSTLAIQAAALIEAGLRRAEIADQSSDNE